MNANVFGVARTMVAKLQGFAAPPSPIPAGAVQARVSSGIQPGPPVYRPAPTTIVPKLAPAQSPRHPQSCQVPPTAAQKLQRWTPPVLLGIPASAVLQRQTHTSIPPAPPLAFHPVPRPPVAQFKPAAINRPSGRFSDRWQPRAGSSSGSGSSRPSNRHGRQFLIGRARPE